ncbi:MAG TPA: acetate/propionate family kinase, partial [Methylomirabilota bacterium]|nr:acetate/propionate family kinase [Methylomirabilota bacterium]
MFQAEGSSATREREPVPDHEAAVRRVLGWLAAGGASEHRGALRVDAVGHRVVHGGARFTEAILIDADVLEAIEALEALAPLHNAPSLAGIRAARAALGSDVPMVAVFDTAFHAAMPEHAYRYAIPHELAVKHGIRRYGFHGLAYRSVLARYAELAGTPLEGTTLVALHLGNGCSAAAIKEGRSIDTSMGLTPLEGLVMETRSGDVDPALIGYLARVEGVPAPEVERWLNERAGLLGLSGQSRDMRDLLAHEQGDPRARLAVDVFCHRARKYLGAYLAFLGGADAVVFSGGIGEHAPEVRTRICAGMEWCGLVLDAERNAAAVGREHRVTRDGAPLAA